MKDRCNVCVSKRSVTFRLTLEDNCASPFLRSKLKSLIIKDLQVERPTGVEPASRAWEARVIPVYDGRTNTEQTPQKHYTSALQTL